MSSNLYTLLRTAPAQYEVAWNEESIVNRIRTIKFLLTSATGTVVSTPLVSAPYTMLRRPVTTARGRQLSWTYVRYYSSPTNYCYYLNFRTVSPIQKVYLWFRLPIQQYIHSTLVVIHSPLSPLHMEYYVYFHVIHPHLFLYFKNNCKHETVHRAKV